MASNHLFESFSPQSLSDWEEKIVKDLKGKALKELSSKTVDGIEIQPHYNNENSTNTFDLTNSKNTNNWKINHVIEVSTDASLANQIALEGLRYGANSLTFKGTIENLEVLLKDIMIDIIDINFEINNPIELIDDLIEYCKNHSYNFNELNGFITKADVSFDKEVFEKLIHSKFKCIALNASRFENNINSFAECLAEYNHILGLLNEHYPVETIISKCFFKITIEQEYFTEISKLRALRLMVNKINQEYGVSKTCFIHAELSTSTWQTEDEENNLLRASTNATAAILGVCDSLYIPPFKKNAHRLSNNIHLLLMEEAYLNKVIDPAAGSYYIEYLTNELIEKSWSVFQKK